MTDDEYLARLAELRPKAGRRPEALNQSRDVNIPAQLARGWAAGLLGLPGDLEGLGRAALNFSFGPGGVNVDPTPALPTSDFYREYLPGYDPAPAARAASGLGALTGGVGATGAVRQAGRAAGALGRVAGEAAFAGPSAGSRAAQRGVIKMPSGNWVSGEGSPEAAVKRLKSREEPVAIPMDDAEMAAYRAQGYTRYDPETGALSRPDPVNQWIDKKLGKYIRNEMGTPEDPIRALAERGVLHIEPQNVFLPADTAFERQAAGFPRHGMAKSQLATDWEVLADAPISSVQAGKLAPQFAEAMPWLSKVPPETPVYAMVPGSTIRNENLGFGHLIDELRNITDPRSGLPDYLRWSPKDLEKVTVPQAVERVAQVNKWRMEQKIAADAEKARNPATFTYKEYDTIPGTALPNEQKLRWVELKAPKLPEGFSIEKDVLGVERLRGPGVDTLPGNRNDPRFSTLETALKYEGETMGHCVGRYCPDVMEGRTRILSLRDAKGEPHVTIEVRPGRPLSERDLPDDVRDALAEQYGDASREEFEAAVQAYLSQRSIPDEIAQIKGKGNRAPKEEYLPFVQDFVRSGKWGRVGDLQNTGLTKLGDQYLPKEEVSALVERASRFIEETPALREHREAQRAYENYLGPVPSAEYTALQRAAGRQVHPTIPYTYRELRAILDDPDAFADKNTDALGPNLERIERLRQLVGEKARAQAAKPAPTEHRMLQGFYRGYAGEYDAPKAIERRGEVYVTPQRAAGEFYAQKRAAQKGLEPHLEMILADPFAGRAYGHSIPTGPANKTVDFTKARQLQPEHVKGVTKLYAEGGAVTAQPQPQQQRITPLEEVMRGRLLRGLLPAPFAEGGGVGPEATEPDMSDGGKILASAKPY